MDLRQIFALFLVIAIVSFLGFCVENGWLMLTKGHMNNRNMVLPFLLGYGLAIIAIYAMFGTPQMPRFFSMQMAPENRVLSTATYFLLVCLCVMLGEIALGTFVEKTCGIVWWNYSRLPLHVTKYTSIPTTLAFGALITVFMDCFFAPLYRSFYHMEIHALGILSCTLMLLMVADFIHSGIAMYVNRELLTFWQIDLSQTYLHRAWVAHHSKT